MSQEEKLVKQIYIPRFVLEGDFDVEARRKLINDIFGLEHNVKVIAWDIVYDDKGTLVTHGLKYNDDPQYKYLVFIEGIIGESLEPL